MRIIKPMVAGLLLAALLSPVARAGEVTRDLAAAALERTDVRIALAHELVTAAPNAIAQSELNTAQIEQGNARGLFTSSQYGLAWTATIRARDHADHAVAIVRNLPDPDRVLVQVERSRDILDRAHDRLGNCDNDRARAMLNVALAMQDKAESAVDDSRYLAALQLTLSARERVTRAMRLCGIEESLSDAADRALQRTDDVLGRALESLVPSTPAPVRDQIARAQTLQSQAQAEARLTHFEPALRLTLGARSLAQQAMRAQRLGGGSPRR